MKDTVANRMEADANAQNLAADPGQSVWVSANAGTGKTRVLIDRITRLLLAGTRPERILCLTFTKAAAAEMANRLNDRLDTWSAMVEPDLNAALMELLDRPASPQEYTRAQRLFAQTMDAPEGLRIRTIHAFCESLLGRFPVEARLSPNFQVIDERRAAELRQETRDRLFLKALDQGSTRLTRAIYHLAGLVDETGFANVMAELDSQRGRIAALVFEHGGLDQLINVSRRALGLSGELTHADTIDRAVTEDAFERLNLQTAGIVLQGGSPKDKKRAAVLTAWLDDSPIGRAARFLDTYLPFFLTQKLTPRAASSLITKKQANKDPAALNALLAEQARVYAVSETLKAVAVADNTAAVLDIGQALLEDYDRLKGTRALLDYDDLISKAGELLTDGDGVSWVHYKLDGGIDHILVDEAQDTSVNQWQVIQALAGDFFSGEGRYSQAASRPSRTVFAVGDEKQSIYSFQGADPSRFNLMGERFSAAIKAANQSWRPVGMAQSWRSTPAILRAVDAVFDDHDAADGLTWNGRQVLHQWTREGQGGCVELWPMRAPLETEEPDPWDAPLDQVPGDDPRIHLAADIAQTVRHWLDDKEVLTARARPIVPGDVMILVRTRGIFADEMVRALKDRNVPVAGSDRMILTQHLAVMDLIALGRFGLLPDDDLNTATVLKGPFLSMSESSVFDLAYDRTSSLWRELNRWGANDPTYAPALKFLGDILARTDFMPPFEFFNTVLSKGGRQSMLARLGSEATDPIDEFMALALDFERDHVPSLEGFLHWVETGDTVIKRDLEQAGGAVRVMTVHGAKGLQAPIVFLTDNGRLPARQLQERLRWAEPEGDAGAACVLWPAFKDNEVAVTEGIADAKRLEIEREYRRLLYVAMTRAEDRLYVTGWHGRREADEACWHQLVEAGLRRLEECREIAHSSGKPILCFETPQTTPPPKSQAPLPLASSVKALPIWARQPAPPEPAPPRPLSPSRPDDEPTVVSPLDNDGGRFKRGRIIHALLQTLPNLAPKAQPAALAAYLAEPAHNLAAAAQTAIGGEVLAILETPEFAPLFSSDSHAEVPIIGDVGTIEPCVISGQMDRLLITHDEVTVVDFKTNRPAPLEESQVASIYLRQMAAYRSGLRRIYPNHQISTVLLWTDGPHLMRLSNDLLDLHAP